MRNRQVLELWELLLCLLLCGGAFCQSKCTVYNIDERGGGLGGIPPQPPISYLGTYELFNPRSSMVHSTRLHKFTLGWNPHPQLKPQDNQFPTFCLTSALRIPFWVGSSTLDELSSYFFIILKNYNIFLDDFCYYSINASGLWTKSVLVFFFKKTVTAISGNFQ